jgi:hypothetical protein
MRPKITALVSLCICVLLPLWSRPSNAQVLIGYLLGEKLSTPTFDVGFEVGLNVSNLDGFPGSERTTHPVFGLFADWRFSEHFHFGTAVLPIAGRGAEGSFVSTTGDAALDDQFVGTVERSAGYVEIPLLLKWAPQRDEGFRVGVGTSLGIVTGATDRYDARSPSGTDYVVELDIADDMPGVDWGGSAEVEWRLSMLSIAVRYTHGFTDMRLNGEPDAIHSRVFTGTGRIYLGKGP